MDELKKLITQMLEGRLSDGDIQRLEAMLENDPEARRIYAEQCHLHGILKLDTDIRGVLKREAPIDFEEEEPVVEIKSDSSFPRRFIAPRASVAAASISIGIFGVWRFSSSTGQSEAEFRTEGSTPESAYQDAAFPGEGSLKRPPTNFAVIAAPASSRDSVSFNRDIRPILSDNCFHCHGPDASTRKAELRLDIEANAFSPHGEFEAAIIPGDPDGSPLFKRIISPLKSEVMPPPDSHKSLNDEEKELVKKWIEQGAEWEGHWAFVKPKKKAAPESEWGNGPIDDFVAAKHRELGLTPNKQADRATLARRLALDLTGLPPMPEIVEGFVADKSPNAYERLIDTFLEDPAYGEHQARFWLDAARYADTHGLHFDNYREIWPYRDWVIDAFNSNKPFDEFTVEQIAGDMLPEATRAQKIATGFSRCNPTTNEGGIIDEEYRVIYAKDRVETTSTVFLGLTMGCASCHDHKFDPLSMEDFYRFSAFFNNVDGPIRDSNARDAKPIIAIPKSEFAETWESIAPEYEAYSARMVKLKKARKDNFKKWLETEKPLFPADLAPPAYVLQGPAREEKSDSETEEEERDPGEVVREQFENGVAVSLPDDLDTMGIDDSFSVSMEYRGVELNKGEERLILSKFDGDRGYRLYLISGSPDHLDRYRLRLELIHSLAAENLLSITTRSDPYRSPRPDVKMRLTVSYDGSGRVSGIGFAGNGQDIPLDFDSYVDGLREDFATAAPLVINPRSQKESSGLEGILGSVTFFRDIGSLYAVPHLLEDSFLRKSFGKKASKRSGRAKKTLETYYFDMLDPETAPLRAEFAPLERTYKFIYEQGAVSLVMKERDEDPFAFLLTRGVYDAKGEKVSAQIPETFGSLPESGPHNRLGLARWLVGSDNPLTARVTVNRLWQNLFGVGLVKTSEDFGIMGENPSHPELLDWLAIDFRENGWDVKRAIKQMVMSATYQQNSRIEENEYRIDPENRFLARGARYRLDGEILRDQALMVSGALRQDVGGPPVRPYQPNGIWDAVAYSRSNTRFYRKDQGDALYRRSVYTFWKRTAPPPNMAVFDVPSRENCSVRRERTNTPLQALTLMNDPQYVEAARLLAQRAVLDVDASADERIDYMYRLAFGAEAPSKHQEALLKSFQRFEENFAKRPQDAAKLIEVGDSDPLRSEDAVKLASLTMVASQIMNLDSFINKF